MEIKKLGLFPIGKDKNRYPNSIEEIFIQPMSEFIANNFERLVLPVYWGHKYTISDQLLTDSKIGNIPITLCGNIGGDQEIEYHEYFRKLHETQQNQLPYLFTNSDTILVILLDNWEENNAITTEFLVHLKMERQKCNPNLKIAFAYFDGSNLMDIKTPLQVMISGDETTWIEFFKVSIYEEVQKLKQFLISD